MKKVLVLALTLLLAVGLLASASAAGKDYSVEGDYVVKTKVPKNYKYSYIYSEPSSTLGENLGRVDDGEEVYVYYKVKGTGDTSSNWAYCDCEDISGYIRFDNLKPYDEDSESSGSDSWFSMSTETGSRVWFSGDCNVRTGPGRDYGVKGSKSAGTSLEYAGDTRYDERGVAWYKVYYGSGTGWVSSMYASFTKSSGGGYYSGGGTVWATYGDANVRSGPGLGYSSIGVLYEDCSAPFEGTVKYDSRGVAWYAIKWNGKTGWVSSKYCTK